MTRGPPTPALTSPRQGTVEQAGPGCGVRPRPDPDGDAEAVDRPGRGHLLVERTWLGHDDGRPASGCDLGHGILAAVGDDDVGRREVGPQVRRR